MCVRDGRCTMGRGRFDYVFTMFGGPGLQICMFRLGEKAPRSILTVYLQCLVALDYKYVCFALAKRPRGQL